MLVLTIDTATSYVVSGLVEVTRQEVTTQHDRQFASVKQPTFEYHTQVLAERIERSPRGHMELLTPNIQELLAEASLRPTEIHAVVVGTGPGPFTGLRVGMATGAAFADAVGVPVFGVDSLAAAVVTIDFSSDASPAVPSDHPILMLSDARRREWYSAVTTSNGTVLSGPSVTAPADVAAQHSSSLPAEAAETFVAMTAEVATAMAHDEQLQPDNWTILSEDAYPAPAGLARAAAEQLWWLDGPGHFVQRLTRPLEAQYLRRPDAVAPKPKPRSSAVDFGAIDQASATDTAESVAVICELITAGSASRQDLTAMVEIEHTLFAGESPWPLDGFITELNNPRNYYVALRSGGLLIGYAGLAMNGPIEDPEWEIHTVAVHPDYQGKGLGRRLIDTLLEPVQVVGGAVFLEVRDGNEAAIGLYRSYGFSVTGRRKGYYQPSGADALTMARPDEKATWGRDPTDDFLVMGIESSCDETGVGVVSLNNSSSGEQNPKDACVVELVNQVASSMEQHARFGGVVPEIASRAHLEAMQPTMRAALRTLHRKVGVGRRPDAIATTIGPGLAGALMVGAAAAKAYAVAWDVPFYAVNHLGGHVAVDALSMPEATAESSLDHAIALLVSGGHTQILEVNGIGHPMKELGSTLDDAAGEAYDKVARLLGLGYPGGPVIDRLAKQGNKKAIAFPRGMIRPQDSRYDFSFSGLKTSVARYVERAEAARNTDGAEERAIPIEDVCASFQEAVVDVLTAKAIRACQDTGAPVMLLGGGVSANSRLRQLAADRCRTAGVELRIPAFPLCTDNGVMIAALASQLIASGAEPSALSVATDPGLEVETPVVHQ